MSHYLIAIVLFLLILPAVGAQLSCSVKQACTDSEIKILRLSNQTNAHAEVFKQTNYNYYLCCPDKISGISITNDCSGQRYSDFDYIINLSAGTNAHASLPNETISYTSPVCIGLTSNGWNASGSSAVHCFGNSTCNTPYAAMLSLSNTTNAHLGNATAYPLRVCCKLDPDKTGPVTSVVGAENGSIYGSPFTFYLNCTDSQSGCSSTQWCNTTPWTSTCTPSQIYDNNITLTAPKEQEIKYRVRFNSTDKVGNEGSIYEINITVSDLLPTCTFDLSPNRYTNNTLLQYNWTGDKKAYDSIVGYDLNWTVTNVSNRSDVRNFLLSFQPGNQSWNLTGANEQEFSVICWAIASKDNTLTNGPWSTPPAVTLIDTQKPTAAISLPTFVTIPSDPGNFTVTWSGQDGNGSGIWVYELLNSTTQSNCSNDTGWSDWLTTNQTQANFTGSRATNYYFRIRATDRAGNTGNWSCNSTRVKGIVQINITLIGTNTTVRPPLALLKLGQSLTVNVSAYSSLNITNLSLMDNNVTIQPLNYTRDIVKINEYQWSGSWSWTPTGYGNHTITVNLTDIEGVSQNKAEFRLVDCFVVGNRSENKTCGNSTGQCTEGIQLCNNQTLLWGNCSGVQPTAEVCDQIDNNCNNNTDEGLNCTCTEGQTRGCGAYNYTFCSPGQQTCTANGTWGACVGAANLTTEICNGQDDDCDGTIDDRSDCCQPGATEEFPTGWQYDAIGECKPGLKECQDGVWSTKSNYIEPTTDQYGQRSEVGFCNDGKDNDCDGKTDDQDSDCGIFPLGPDFPWWLLIGAGGAVLAVVLFLFFRFRARGEELTWETLMKRYGG